MPTRISLLVSPLTSKLARTIVYASPLSTRRSSMIFLSLCGTFNMTWYSGTMARGMSRPNRDMPVVLHTTICGFPVAPSLRSWARVSRMLVMPFLQTSGSSIVIFKPTNLAPIVEMISSTSFPFSASRQLETAAISCALPWII